MSQLHNPTDSQGLLQSMLQRLKLQPGREDQPLLHTPVAIAGESTLKEDGQRRTSNHQKVNNSSVNGFQFGTNGVSLKELGISAANSNSGLNDGEVQQQGHGCEMDRGVISFPSQKDNTDNATGENRAVGQATLPGISPTGTGQLFPTKSFKDADITSNKTDDERLSLGSPAMAGHVLGDKDKGFTPKVYVWSLKPTDANFDIGSQDNKVLHVGNGGFGPLAQSKDMQFVASGQNPKTSSLRRKPWSSENKTRRWTQRIKERWMDRSGSSDKRAKKEGAGMERKSAQETEISPQKQLLTAENLSDKISNKEEDRALHSLERSDPSETPLTHTEDSTGEVHIRSSRDFEFGLGSFSLLEEIVTGQEWGKFLNPNLTAASANQRPPEEPLSQLKIPPNPYNGGQSSLILNQQKSGNDAWSSRGTEMSPASDFSMAQISPDAFLPVSMDVSERKQQQYVHRVPDQSEPMDDWQSGERGWGQQHKPPSFVEPANIVDNSELKRVHLNRKRQHQSAEQRDERLQTEKISNGKEAGRGGSVYSQSINSHDEMDGTGGSQHIDMPSYTQTSSTPLSPSAFNHFAPVPRGVLKHSMSQDSESSMGTLTKRRRVEENRRVRFSEEVMTIAPPELDVGATDSEADSEAEDDSVTEQEFEVEQAVVEEEVAPVRRPALPAWIQALKRRNMGRKHRL